MIPGRSNLTNALQQQKLNFLKQNKVGECLYSEQQSVRFRAINLH
jgi:hypothetical protein